MVYNLANEYDKSRFEMKVKNLINEKALVELNDKRVRSLSQNAYLHVCLGVVAMELGETLDYVKRYYFKILVNPEVFVYEKEDKYFGKIKSVRSSASIEKDVMSKAIEKFRQWAMHNDTHKMYIPEPNEEVKIKCIMSEMSRSKYL